jgi:hypothetical protein
MTGPAKDIPAPPGTSRSEIRRHGDDQDKADPEAADAELKARRSRKGIRHRRHPRRAAGQDQPGAAVSAWKNPSAQSPSAAAAQGP